MKDPGPFVVQDAARGRRLLWAVAVSGATLVGASSATLLQTRRPAPVVVEVQAAAAEVELRHAIGELVALTVQRFQPKDGQVTDLYSLELEGGARRISDMALGHLTPELYTLARTSPASPERALRGARVWRISGDILEVLGRVPIDEYNEAASVRRIRLALERVRDLPGVGPGGPKP